MKKILLFFACAVVALSTVSCVADGLSIPEPEKEGLTLRFSLGNPATKEGSEPTTVAGELNENRINKIDYFFFKVVDGVISEDTAPIIDMRTLTPEAGKERDIDYDLTLSATDLLSLYPNADDQVAIYAIANFTGVYPTSITLAGLKEIEVRNTFAHTDRWPHPFKTNDNDLCFIMTGEKILDLTAASNVVPLIRLASKVTVEFTYHNVADKKDSRLTWVPQSMGTETRVYLSNAIATTTLGGPLDTETRPYITDSGTTWSNGTRDIFEYAYDYMVDLKGAKPYYYTYPINMKAGDDNQPYIKLVLPWYAYENTSFDNDGNLIDGAAPVKQKEVYYKIALPIDDLKESNRIYEYSVDITIIGSDTEVLVPATYRVKNWDSDDVISSNLATGQYLSLDIPKNTYDMYSDLVQILYVSSGDVDVIVNDIYQENLSSATGASKNHFMQNNVVTTDATLLADKNIDADDVEGWVTTIIKDGRPMLQVSHKLDNSMTTSTGDQNKAFDMAPYVYDVTLHLVEDSQHTFDKNIVITQYPSMFITLQKSNGYVFVNRTGWGNTNYDDGQNLIGNLTIQPGSLNGTGTNNNPNLYTISTSIAPDSSYEIGDPRMRGVNNLSNLNDLTNYYPTNPSGTEKLISPRFIVASSYGKENQYHSLEAAQKRCASYQENGYPAGRWRVPTFAEIRFLVTLSERNFIPSLFLFSEGDTVGYWSANGKVIGDSAGLPELNTEFNNINTAVRCVYDAWYWGDAPITNSNTTATFNASTNSYSDAATNWRGFHDND